MTKESQTTNWHDWNEVHPIEQRKVEFKTQSTEKILTGVYLGDTIFGDDGYHWRHSITQWRYL